MTETAGITVSNFIAGALALGLSLMIIPTIVKGSIGASTGAVNQQEYEKVYSKINGLCGSDPGTKVEGELSMGGQYEIIIAGDDMTVKKNGNIINGWDHKTFSPNNCNTNDGATYTLEGTRPYKFKIISDDDENDNEFELVD